MIEKAHFVPHLFNSALKEEKLPENQVGVEFWEIKKRTIIVIGTLVQQEGHGCVL